MVRAATKQNDIVAQRALPGTCPAGHAIIVSNNYDKPLACPESWAAKSVVCHHHVMLTCTRSPTARGSSHASHLPWDDVAFSSTQRDRHLGIILDPFRSSI